MARRSDHTREELHRMALSAAKTLITKSGLRELSTRGIAKKIGYAPGTLYQLFKDLDELILRVNAGTLDDLYAACKEVDFGKAPESALSDLAKCYIEFTSRHPRLWNALFEHGLPKGRTLPAWYAESVAKLLGLAERAIQPLFHPSAADQMRNEARILWASLYGIGSLATAGKLGPATDPLQMVDTLVCNYLAGLRARGEHADKAA